MQSLYNTVIAVRSSSVGLIVSPVYALCAMDVEPVAELVGQKDVGLWRAALPPLPTFGQLYEQLSDAKRTLAEKEQQLSEKDQQLKQYAGRIAALESRLANVSRRGVGKRERGWTSLMQSKHFLLVP